MKGPSKETVRATRCVPGQAEAMQQLLNSLACMEAKVSKLEQGLCQDKVGAYIHELSVGLAGTQLHFTERVQQLEGTVRELGAHVAGVGRGGDAGSEHRASVDTQVELEGLKSTLASIEKKVAGMQQEL